MSEVARATQIDNDSGIHAELPVILPNIHDAEILADLEAESTN